MTLDHGMETAGLLAVLERYRISCSGSGAGPRCWVFTRLHAGASILGGRYETPIDGQQAPGPAR